MTQPAHPAPGATAPDPTVVYAGYGGTDTSKPAMVLLETPGGQVLGPLRHVVKHSPTGFAWGYGGSGPADLARSLLIDAAGDAATCPTCHGCGRVVFDAQGEPLPWCDGQDPVIPSNEPSSCWDCEGGVRALPYQDFKFEVIGALPDTGWRIERRTVQAWLAAHGVELPA